MSAFMLSIMIRKHFCRQTYYRAYVQNLLALLSHPYIQEKSGEDCHFFVYTIFNFSYFKIDCNLSFKTRASMLGRIMSLRFYMDLFNIIEVY